MRVCRELYRHLAFEYFLEGYESFGTGQTQSLNLVLEYVQKVVVVVGHDFYKDVVLAGGKVALNDFGYVLQLFDDMVELSGITQEETYVGAGVVTDCRRIDKTLRAFDDTVCNQALYTLVYGCA